MIELKELFDSGVPYKLYNSGPSGLEYYFTVANREYEFTLPIESLDKDKARWDIQTMLLKLYGREIFDLSTEGSLFSNEKIGRVYFKIEQDEVNELDVYGITDTGSQFSVFSTVIAILQEIVRKEDFFILSFSADREEPSRIKLYQLFTKKIKRFLPEYEVLHQEEGAFDYMFYLYKPKTLNRYTI